MEGSGSQRIRELSDGDSGGSQIDPFEGSRPLGTSGSEVWRPWNDPFWTCFGPLERGLRQVRALRAPGCEAWRAKGLSRHHPGASWAHGIWMVEVRRGSQMGSSEGSQNDPFWGSEDLCQTLGSRSLCMAGGGFRTSRRHTPPLESRLTSQDGSPIHPTGPKWDQHH